MQILGIDVGCSGIKCTPVDISTGYLLAEPFRIKPPKGAEPKLAADVVAEITKSFNWMRPK